MIIHLLSYLLIPTILGYCLVNLICKEKPLPLLFALALGYGIGTGILTHWVLILNFLHIPHFASAINLPLVGLTAFLIFRLYKQAIKPNFSFPKDKPSIDILGIIFTIYIMFILSYIFWYAVNIPISTWDAYSTMGLKAKTICYDHSLRYISNIPKFDYPIHLPILLSWLSSSVGYWDNSLLKIFFPLSCLCYLIVQYFFMRYFVKPRWALFSIALVLTSNFFIYHSGIAYRDITMLYYNCTSILLLILWAKNKQSMFLILAALFSGFTSFIKLEGIGYLFQHSVLLCLLMCFVKFLPIRGKLNLVILFLCISFGIYSIFYLYKKIYILPHVPSHLINPDHFDLSRISLNLSAETFGRLKTVLLRYKQNLFLSGNWNLIWSLLIISCFNLMYKDFTFDVKALFLSLFLFFIIYFVSFIFTQHYLWIAVGRSVLSRSILHIMPIATVLITILNFSEQDS